MIGTVNFVTNCVLVYQMVRLLLAPVVEPRENACRMNRVFSIFLLLPILAMAICRGKPLGSVFDKTNVASWGPSFGSSRQDGGDRFHRQDGSP